MVVFGAGFGMVTQILMVAIQNAVSPREIGTATAAANLFLALRGSVGRLDLRGGVRRRPAPLAAARSPRSRAARHHRHRDPEHPGRSAGSAPAIQHGIANAVGNSLHDVFLLAAPIALAGCLITPFLRERPLRGREQTQPRPAIKSDADAPRERVAAWDTERTTTESLE